MTHAIEGKENIARWLAAMEKRHNLENQIFEALRQYQHSFQMCVVMSYFSLDDLETRVVPGILKRVSSAEMLAKPDGIKQ